MFRDTLPPLLRRDDKLIKVARGEIEREKSNYYLFYDNFISWGKKLSSFYKSHPNNIFNFIDIGCLWSEHARRIIETEDFPEKIKEIRAKYKQNGGSSKKIVGVFDTSFGAYGEKTVPLTFYDMKCFLEGILNLADERKDLVFLVKPKNPWDYITEESPEIIPYYTKMKTKSGFYLLNDLQTPSPVNAICDLTISACFTTTAVEALGFGKKAIYFDATGRFKGYYYDRFPNFVAHGYKELVNLVDYWLYKIKDDEFSEYIDRHIKGELDPYADGFAITRFRELLTKR